MTRDQQRLADYLAHIAQAIERIDRYTGSMDEVAFLNNQLVQDAVIRNFEIIGEASNNIEKSSDLRNRPSALTVRSRDRVWEFGQSGMLKRPTDRPAQPAGRFTRGRPCGSRSASQGCSAGRQFMAALSHRRDRPTPGKSPGHGFVSPTKLSKTRPRSH